MIIKKLLSKKKPLGPPKKIIDPKTEIPKDEHIQPNKIKQI